MGFCKKELNKVNGAINRCVMFIKEGDGSPNIVREELHALEIRREELYNGKWLRAKPTIKFSTTRRWPTSIARRSVSCRHCW